MKISALSTLLLTFILVTPVKTFCAESNTKARFYERKAEGWFWYKEEPHKTQKKITLPKKIKKTKKIIAPLSPTMLSAKWFRKNLPKYKDLAWNNPTIENVKMFLYLQRYAIDRSEQFANTTQLAVIGDPFLDEITRRPSATFASQQIDRKAGSEKKHILQRIAKRAGIFFFYKSNDDNSNLQAPIIKMLRNENFSIIPISKDGNALANGLFPDFRKDNGHARKLGITTFPSVFLVSPNGKFASLGQGVMSLPELKNRILIVAKRNGWISDDEFNQTRPILNINNTSALIDPSKFEKALKTLPNDTNKDNFIPPAQLLKYFRTELKRK